MSTEQDTESEPRVDEEDIVVHEFFGGMAATPVEAVSDDGVVVRPSGAMGFSMGFDDIINVFPTDHDEYETRREKIEEARRDGQPFVISADLEAEA